MPHPLVRAGATPKSVQSQLEPNVSILTYPHEQVQQSRQQYRYYPTSYFNPHPLLRAGAMFTSGSMAGSADVSILIQEGRLKHPF